MCRFCGGLLSLDKAVGLSSGGLVEQLFVPRAYNWLIFELATVVGETAVVIKLVISWMTHTG